MMVKTMYRKGVIHDLMKTAKQQKQRNNFIAIVNKTTTGISNSWNSSFQFLVFFQFAGIELIGGKTILLTVK